MGDNDIDNDGDVDNDDLEQVFDWSAWNDNAEDSLNYWRNKYDRGECTYPVDPCTSGTSATTGTSGTTGQPEPEVYYCPRINSVGIEPCSKIKVFIKGGKDAY